jgi:hypothetical protein
MITGLTYLFTSLALVFLLPILRRGSGHEELGEVKIYRYSKNINRFFMLLIPVFVIPATVYSPFPLGQPNSSLIAFAGFTIFMISLPTIIYLYFSRYRVRIDSTSINVLSIFGNKSIRFRLVSKIATYSNKSVDLWLYDESDKTLAKIGGSLQDFDFLLLDVEHNTRSPNVILFKGNAYTGWEEGPNTLPYHWQSSQGPAAWQNINRRVKWFCIAGLALASVAYFVLN